MSLGSFKIEYLQEYWSRIINTFWAFFTGFRPRRAAGLAERPNFSFAIIIYHPKEHSVRVSAFNSKFFLNGRFRLDISRSVMTPPPWHFPSIWSICGHPAPPLEAGKKWEPRGGPPHKIPYVCILRNYRGIISHNSGGRTGIRWISGGVI